MTSQNNPCEPIPSNGEGCPNDGNSSHMCIDKAEQSLILELVISSEEEAYKLYNAYARTIGFGTRLHNIWYTKTGLVKGREYVCAKHGFKIGTNTKDKKCTKLDIRTGCMPKVFFEVNAEVKWVVRRHDMVHNHTFCPQDKVHLLKSHMNFSPDQLDLLKKLVNARVKVVNAVRFMRSDAGGSESLGFTTTDAYNALAVERNKRFDRSDAQSLINMFLEREKNEPDFFFDFKMTKMILA